MPLHLLLEHLQFLDASQDPTSALIETYDPQLVLLSVVIAFLTAYSALQVVGRIRAAQTAMSRNAWLVTGAMTIGFGLWAMHFIGMLALLSPIWVSYNILINRISMLPSIFASAVMLLIISRERVSIQQLLLGGTLMGAGIATMHYIGMAAAQTNAIMVYDPELFVLSILVVVLLAIAALSVKFLTLFRAPWRQLALACVIGCALAGMHYTAMAATNLFPATSTYTSSAFSEPVWLVSWTTLLSLLVICATIFITGLDQRLGMAKEAEKNLETLVAWKTLELDAANALLQFELEQRRHARQIQLIMDTVPNGVILLASDYRILTTNQIAEEYLEQLEAGIRQNVLQSLGGKAIEQLLADCASNEWDELATTTPAKQLFEVTARVVDTGTSLEGWLVVLRDITRERERQRYAQTQERLVTVGQLAAGIAHDFNNILVIISLHTEMVLARPSSPKATQNLQTILRQTQRATTLVAQILAFSRRSIMQISKVDLFSFLKETISLLEHALPENIRIQMDGVAETYFVKADFGQLQQVIMNMSFNARDAMPNGGLLRFELDQFEVGQGQKPPLPNMHTGKWVKLAIRDTGIGINESNFAHIFEPFFTTKGSKGTGLGLAQVYGIVKQHQGEIAVWSEVGQGTCFSIYLPALSEAPESITQLDTLLPQRIESPVLA